ncbi:MAG TPA: tetratricopeptide repeat protein, partial [Polyangiaceae bacterium]|nr:tetratricopeptide repeat protein [Polyangiaceae bacterium]
RTKMIGRRLAGASLLVSCLLATGAHAQSNEADSERANLLFKKGKQAFNDGKYDDALRIYGEAWRLKQSPDIAANLAQTESELGKHRAAAEHFSFALAHLLPSSTDEQKLALSEGLAKEKKEVGTLHVTLEPADSKIAVDGTEVALPVDGDLFVDPGEHRCSITHEGYDTNEQTVKISKGGSQVLWIKLNALGGAAPSANAIAPSAPSVMPGNPPPNLDRGTSNSRSLVPAFIGGGIAVVGLAAGVGFLLSGNSHGNKADEISQRIPGENGCGAGTLYSSDCAALHDENQSGASARKLETVSFVVAGAAALGTALYLLWPHGAAAASGSMARSVALGSIIPDIQVSRGMGTLSISGRF